jgi:hypothetical protein
MYDIWQLVAGVVGIKLDIALAAMAVTRGFSAFTMAGMPSCNRKNGMSHGSCVSCS